MISNIFSNIPDNLKDEWFDEILSRSDVRVERIVSRGHSSPDDFWYDQEMDEWVLLVRGGAGLAFEGESAIIELKPGDHLLIPARRRHRVAWTSGKEDTIWLAVHLCRASPQRHG